MIAQVRTYTFNKGMMDQWVSLFNETLATIHAQNVLDPQALKV
jgi:hypothetical protein